MRSDLVVRGARQGVDELKSRRDLFQELLRARLIGLERGHGDLQTLAETILKLGAEANGFEFPANEDPETIAEGFGLTISWSQMRMGRSIIKCKIRVSIRERLRSLDSVQGKVQ